MREVHFPILRAGSNISFSHCRNQHIPGSGPSENLRRFYYDYLIYYPEAFQFFGRHGRVRTASWWARITSLRKTSNIRGGMDQFGYPPG